MNDFKDLDFVSLEKLRKIIKKMKDKPSNTPISFEFLVASCFPHVWNNVIIAMGQKYAEGYHQGQKDKEKELKGDSK